MKVFLTIMLCVTLGTCFSQAQLEGVKLINGANLYIRIVGKGEYLLIVHGGPGLNHSYFRPYLDALARDYTLIYYDQRACGQSSIPSKDSITMNFFVEDMEAIRNSLGIDKLNILGHSWGAFLVANYCKAYPSNVNKVVFSNPAPFSKEYDAEMAQYLATHISTEDSAKRAQIITARDFSVAGMTTLMKINFNASAYSRSNIDKLNLDLQENFAQASGALFGGLGKDLTAYNLYDDVRKFNFPVLIITGRYDGIPQSSIDRLKKAVPGCRLIQFKRSGHFPFLEEPGRFESEVRKFLK